MDDLERDLERVFRSVHPERPAPDDLPERVRRRQNRRAYRRWGRVVGGAAAVALVIAGGAYLGGLTQSGTSGSAAGGGASKQVTSSAPASAARLDWSAGRISVDPKRDDAVAADSVLGFLDSRHAVVDPYGGETASTLRELVVDLDTGRSEPFVHLPLRGTRPQGGFTKGVYVWAARGEIHATDVGSGERWTIGKDVTSAEVGADHPKSTRDQVVVGDGYVAWRDLGKHGTPVYAAPVRGGAAHKISAVTPSDQLRIDSGRLVAYDNQRVRVVDIESGAIIHQRRFRVQKGTDLIQPMCSAVICIRGKRASDHPYADYPDINHPQRRVKEYYVIPEVLRIADGTVRPIRGAPVIKPIVRRDNHGRVDGRTSPPTPYVSGRWVTFGTAWHDSRTRSYLYDSDTRNLTTLGRGQVALTQDGWVVRAPALTPDMSESSAKPTVRIRYARLPD